MIHGNDLNGSMANGSLPSSKFQPITASLLFPCCSSRVKACTKGQSSAKFDHDSLSLRLKNTLNPPSAELELFKMDREQGHLSYISVRNSAVRGFNPNHTNVSKKALQNWTMCDYRRLKFVVRTDFFTFFFSSLFAVPSSFVWYVQTRETLSSLSVRGNLLKHVFLWKSSSKPRFIDLNTILLRK